MGWPLKDTDQAEGPHPTQIDHRRPPRVVGGHLRCPLYDPRIRTVTLTTKELGLYDLPGETGKLREMREMTPTAMAECISSED